MLTEKDWLRIEKYKQDKEDQYQEAKRLFMLKNKKRSNINATNFTPKKKKRKKK